MPKEEGKSGSVCQVGSFSGGSDGEEPACNAGDQGLRPESGRSPGEVNGNPLQYSCLEDTMDRRAWQAPVHRVPKSQTQLSNFQPCSGGFPGGVMVKNPSADAGDSGGAGSIPESGRSPGVGNGNHSGMLVLEIP